MADDPRPPDEATPDSLVDELDAAASTEPHASGEGDSERGDGSFLAGDPNGVSVFKPNGPTEASTRGSRDTWFAEQFDQMERQIEKSGRTPLTLGTKPAADVGSSDPSPNSTARPERRPKGRGPFRRKGSAREK